MARQTSISATLRRRQVAGLILILAVILAFSIFRAGVANVFPRGWWHIW